MLFLRILRYLLLGVLACKKNYCYFCDVGGLFEVLLGHFFISKSGIWLKLLLLFFAIFVTRYLNPCYFSLRSKRFLASSSRKLGQEQKKKRTLLRFLRHLRTFRVPSWLLLFLGFEFCDICYFVIFAIFVIGVFSCNQLQK